MWALFPAQVLSTYSLQGSQGAAHMLRAKLHKEKTCALPARLLKCTHKHLNTYCLGKPNVASLCDILVWKFTLCMKNTGVVMEILHHVAMQHCYWTLLSDWITLTPLSLDQNTARITTWGSKDTWLRAVDASADCASSRPWQSWGT